MKNLIITFCLLIGLQTINAQQAFTGPGDMKLQVAFAPYGRGTGIVGTFDYGIFDYISVGGGLEYYSVQFQGGNVYFFGRGNLHLNPLIDLPEQLDIYPGLQVGVIGSFIDWGIYAGVRYFFTDTFGAFAELGNQGKIGVSISF